MASCTTDSVADLPNLLAKRLIFKKYAQAYIPSMLSPSYGSTIKLSFFDGFAGSGKEMTDDWPSEIEKYGYSLIALHVALHYFKKTGKEDATFDTKRDVDVDAYLNGIEHLKKNIKTVIQIDHSTKHKINFIFVENDKTVYKELVKNVIQVIKRYRLRVDIDPDFGNGICKVRSDFRGTKRTLDEYLVACYIVHADFSQMAAPRGHCLAVIDPPVYTDAPLGRVKTFVGRNKQIFINLHSKRPHPGRLRLGRSATAEALTPDVIGSVIQVFEQDLRQEAKTDFVISFNIQDIGQALQCHVLFVTNHISSFRFIKESVNTVMTMKDYVCQYKLVGIADPKILSCRQTENSITNIILDRFGGKGEVSISEVESFVLLETPFVFRKTPLAKLETRGHLSVITRDPRRRKCTYPDYRDWKLEFRQIFKPRASAEDLQLAEGLDRGKLNSDFWPFFMLIIDFLYLMIDKFLKKECEQRP